MDFIVLTSLLSSLKAEAWITLAILIVMFILLLKTKIPSEFVYFGTMASFYITGALSEKETFSSFSTIAVVTVGVLYVVMAGLIHTGVLNWVIDKTLGKPRQYSSALFRMMVPAALCSAIIFNSVVTTVFMKKIKAWARSLSLAPSKMLLPLSYAAGLGGVCTIIGTPPNILLSSMVRHDLSVQMDFFAPFIPGICCAVAGILVLILFRRLLPDRRTPQEIFEEAHEYTVEFLVPDDSYLVGRTVEETKLLIVEGGRLAEIVRDGKKVICPVQPDETIEQGDRLIYAGRADELMQLRKTHELAMAEPVFSVKEPTMKRLFYTASLQHDSLLAGYSMSNCDLESNHNVTLLAVVREGELIDENPYKVKLGFQDVLLFEGNPDRKGVLEKTAAKDLIFVDSIYSPKYGVRTLVSFLIVMAMILLQHLGVMTLLQSAMLAAIAMMATYCCTTTQAWHAINWNTIMVFASSIAIAVAVQHSGISYVIAKEIVTISGWNPIAAIVCICVLASITTEFITDTAVAAIFYPIALTTALLLGQDAVPFIIALMIAVSTCFATPIGTPSNRLVYSEGGYHPYDYLTVGIPMKLVTLVVSITVISLLYDL